jgi:ABC-type bacteriocin/lantibiotic exporter with double-glycine peptidase domain
MDAKQRLKRRRNGQRIQWQNAKRRGNRSVTGSEFQSQSKVTRRWTVIASGLLLLALALVVIYTGPNAFYSPVALVVVAAIGLAALLLQVWFHRDLPLHSPLWLNILGILCAMVTLFSDYLRMTRGMLYLVAFGAVVCFGISGSLILHALRRRVRTPQSSEVE